MKKSWLLVAAGAALGSFYAYGRVRQQVRSFRYGHDRPGHRLKVVILGAGFGGLAAANKLARDGRDLVDILVVDKNNYHLFTPPLFQVAACGINPWDVARPIRPIGERHGFEFTSGELGTIDLDGRSVKLLDGRHLRFDYLIIALGSRTNFFQRQDAETFGLPLKTVEDALTLRNRVLDAFEMACTEQDGDLRRELLTFVIVGGGATGVELAGALRDLVGEVLAKEYRMLSVDEVRIVVVESHDRLLGHLGEPLAREAQRHLTNNNVEVVLNTKVASVQPNMVETDDGKVIRTRTVVWTAGVAANSVAASLEVPKGKGDSLRVDEFLRLVGHPEIFAVGDNASFKDPDSGQSVPLLASVAIQQGEAAANNLLKSIVGRQLDPFHYRHITNMVALGRDTGAAEIGGTVIRGFAGWLLWRTVHLALLTGFRDKLGMAIDWTFAYFYRRDTSRLRITSERQVAKEAIRPSIGGRANATTPDAQRQSRAA